MSPHDPNDPDHLTAPERAAARAQAKATRDKVNASGGCACCLRRDRATEGWDLALCGLKPPAEFKKRGCDFAPDHDKLYPSRHEQD